MHRPYTEAESDRIKKTLADNPQFIRSLSDPDDFRAIIIGQTYIEAALNQLIEGHRKKPMKSHEGLRQNLELAESKGGLPISCSEVLRRLAAIRNDFAHKLGYHEIPAAKMDNLRSALQEHNVGQVLGFFYLKQQFTDGTLSQAVWTDSVLVRATIAYYFELLIAAYEAQQSSSESPFKEGPPEYDWSTEAASVQIDS